MIRARVTRGRGGDAWPARFRRVGVKSWCGRPRRIIQMLVQGLPGGALVRVVSTLHAAYLAAPLVELVVVVAGIPRRNIVRNTEQFRRTVVSLHGFALGDGLVKLPSYVHALVGKHAETPEFLLACALGMPQIRHQPAAPGSLNADLPCLRI